MSFDMIKKNRISFVQFINEEKISTSEEIDLKFTSYENRYNVKPKSNFTLKEVCSLLEEIKREMLNLNQSVYTRLSVDGVGRISSENMKEELSKAKAEIESVQSEFKKRDSTISELQHEKDRLLATLKEKESSIKTLRASIDQKERELAQLQEKITSLEQMLNKDQDSLVSLETEVKSKDSELSILEKKNKELESKIYGFLED